MTYRTLPKAFRLFAPVMLLALLLGLGGGVWVAVEQAVALDALPCDLVVGPDETYVTIQSAVDSAFSGQMICINGGVYHEAVKIIGLKQNLTLIAMPGQYPVIDGQKRLPGGAVGDRFKALLEVMGAGTTIDGLEIRFSSARGLDVSANGITIRNTSVHDNWSTGINVTAGSPPTDVLIENNYVYRNMRRSQHAPVVYKGERTGSGPSDWTFDPDTHWDTPFWSGAHADLPEQWLNGLSMTFNDDGHTDRVYAGSARAGRVGNINAEYSAHGAFSYSWADILFHEPAINKWTLYFDGEQRGIPQNSVIDAFQIESMASISESWPCDMCAPVLLSFTATISIPITTDVLTPTITQTAIEPSDLIYFRPTEMNDTRINQGYFTLYKRAADLVGLPEGANIDALDRAPDGRLLISLSATYTLTNPDSSTIIAEREDLVAYDETTGYWTLFFEGDQIPYNPFQAEDLTAAWIDDVGNIYVSGDPIGGSALTLISTRNSTARGNHVYNNFGEGLVVDRGSIGAVAEDNVLYDNQHANLYLNSTISTTVRSNFVYCTDDQTFWRKGSGLAYKPGPGIQIRDELWLNDLQPLSSGYVIVNNIVYGCGTNFGVSSQRPGGGLNNSLVANNTFAHARAASSGGVDNVNFAFNSGVSVNGSFFINNLLLQSPSLADRNIRFQGVGDLSNFTIANNLYSPNSDSLPSQWPQDEPGRIVTADPRLMNAALAGQNPPLPVMGTPPDSADFRLTYDSPALDAGQALAEVVDDFFAMLRTGNGAPDIGANELPHVGRITVTQTAVPGDVVQQFDFLANFSSGTFSLQNGGQFDSGILEAGVYSVSSIPVNNWTTAATCSDGSPITAISLGPNETVNCSFTSVRETRLILDHTIEPDNGALFFDFTLSPGESFQLGSDSRTFTVEPGDYSLTAAVPQGWRQEATCDNSDTPDALTLAAGEWVICTFTHREPGRIIVTKLTDPPNTPGTFDFTASYAPGGFDLGHGQSRDSGPLPSGAQYSVAEVLPAGWMQLGATCDDGSLPDAIGLAAGEVVICTYTNARLALGLAVEPAPGAVTTPGGDVEFAVRVFNDGDVPVGAISLIDSIYGDVTDVNNPALVSTNCELLQSLAAGEDYTCAFTAYIAGAGGTVHNSTLTASGMGPGSTPVSTAAETAVTINIPLPGRIIVTKQTDPPDASGVFQFTASYGNFNLSNGHSHDSGLLPSGVIYSVTETLPAGWAISSATCTGDDDGTDPTAIMLDPGEVVSCIFVNSRTTSGPLATFYLTTPKAGKVRGMAYSPGDILAYDNATATWSIYFDASNVGLTKALGDFVLLDDGSILLTIGAKVKLRDGNNAFITVTPQDIVRFVPTGPGPTTAGYFEMYFDGSDVALSTAAEKIDALALRPDGALLISTSGAATVKNKVGANIKAQDEDLLVFKPTSWGDTTDGEWDKDLALDGSTLPGMAAEDVTSVWYDAATDDLYLTITNNFTIGGEAGTNRTILKITPSKEVSTYWDLSNAGFPALVDGLHIVRE